MINYALVQFKGQKQTYTYINFIEELEQGDMVVVCNKRGGGYAVANVVEIVDEDPDKGTRFEAISYIFGRVDCDKFDDFMKKEEARKQAIIDLENLMQTRKDELMAQDNEMKQMEKEMQKLQKGI